MSLDPGSALSLQNSVSPYLLYTELSTGGSRGMMRSVSIIDNKWIESYLKRIKEIDFFRLSGIELERNSNIKLKEK